MTRNIILIILFFNFISCRNIEENNLLKYSEENKSYEITKTEKYLNEKDSLIRKERKLVSVYDSKDRLISTNNNSFNFYNSKNKLSETKSVYRRKGNGIIVNITENKYLYNEKGNLIKIVNPAEKESIIKTFEYDEFGNLISEVGLREIINYEYSNRKIAKKTILENNEISEISKYKYDKLNRIITEDWFFSETDQMRIYYKYYPNNKLFSKRDSSYSKVTNPNQYVEFLKEYYYDIEDSIIEIRDLGRVASEKDFKLRGKTKFEYLKK